MSTLFEVPCPECGRQMLVAGADELRCPACKRAFHVRMGHLFPVTEPPVGGVVGSESPPGRGAGGRPAPATP
jgi:hypothetical protein